MSTEAVQIENCLVSMLPLGFYMGIADRCAIEEFSLHPIEAACLSPRATSKRRSEFIMGRAAAHAALVKLGKSASGIGKNRSGAPIWPPDIVGSITHKNDAALAIVAPTQRCRGVGVDIESADDPIKLDISRRICHPEEIPWVVKDHTLSTLRLKLIFSAKESLFKTLNTFNGGVFSFTDIRLRWDEKQKWFDIGLPEKVHRTLSFKTLSPVRCGITDHSVVTFFVLW